MVSPSKPKHSRVASQEHSHKYEIIRGPKPLINFKFYLDIEKHHIESKIEKNIRELGGSIEFFFDKEVTHFVTDKQIKRDGKLLNAHHIQQHHSSQTNRTTNTNVVVTPHTPQHQNPTSSLLLSELTDTASPNGTSNDARATCSKPKSRADAMLQRSRSVQQQQQRQPVSFEHSAAKSQSPVQLAQTWDKPIWTPEYTLEFLEYTTQCVKLDRRNRHHHHHHHHRIGVGVVGGGGGGNASPNTIGIVSSKTKSSHQASYASTTAAIGVGGALIGHGAAKSRTANAKHLNGDYIKIESTQKHYRPYYQEIKCWPKLNLNGICPFQGASDKAKINDTLNNQNNPNPNRKTNANGQQTATSQQLKRRSAAVVENIAKLGNRQTSGVHGATAVAAGTFVSTAVDLKHHSSRSGAFSVKSHLKITPQQRINDTNQSTMTRKTRNKRDVTTVDGCNIKGTTVTNDIIKRTTEKCGYCEKCRIEYESLSVHLQSIEHMNFVKNSDNYLALDNLINSGANVETFLKMNSSSRSPQKHTATSPTSTKSASPIDSVTAAADKNGQLMTATLNHVNHNHNAKMRKNSIRRSSDGSMKMDVDEDAIPISEFKQMNGNGTAAGHDDHDDEPLSPKSINSSRDKLPKYSPPITRRSQIKTNKSPTKSQSSPTKSTFERFNFLVDTKEKTYIGESTALTCQKDKSRDKSHLQSQQSNHHQEMQCQTEKTRLDDDSPQMKRIFRAFPRYKVVDGCKSLAKNMVASVTSGTETATTTAITTTTTTSQTIPNNCEVSASLDTRSEPMHDRHKDPTTGIIVKFKRVRESELSKLTYEADNFMFPKQRDDLPTDEDRQTTSERGIVDITSDIVSSELEETRLGSPTRKSNTFSDESDQFTSSGRRKKRRTQYDSYIDSSVYHSGGQQQSNHHQQCQKDKDKSPVKDKSKDKSQQQQRSVTRRSTKSAKAAAAAAATATTADSTNCEPINSDNGGSSALDSDGKYNGGSILSTDFFKTLKFSFERVPTNEPWYLTFQRQDECRERIFEYWGNTAYRKLPFELGPLPALQSDCCILSKLAALKATKQQKNRRGRGGRQKAKNLCDMEASTADGEDSAIGFDGNAPTATTTTTVTRSMPKVDANSIPLSTTTTGRKMSTSMSDPPKHFARSNSQNMWKMDPLESIPPKKRTMLLDAFGQPRKSPREHASTLAILSSLVQQKRKRLREMNGGISPEKMPNYNSSSAANGTPADGTDNDELDDDDFCDNDSYHTKHADIDIDDQQSRGSISNRTPLPDAEINDNSTMTTAAATAISCQKVFRLRKGKRRQTASTSSHNEMADVKTEDTTTTAAANDSGKESTQSKEIKFPKMPIDNYVDPNKIARQIDEILSASYADTEPEIDDIAVNVSEESDDLILVSTPKDFIEIVNSVKEGPLTYRSFVNVNKKTGLSSFIQRGKKRHINKTGWPSLPKKRLAIKKEKLEGSCAEDDTNVAQSNTEDDDNVSTMGGVIVGTDGDRIDISSQLKGDEFFIQARRGMKTPTQTSATIKEENFDETEPEENYVDDGADGGDEDDDFEVSPFCTDNAVNNVFASSSEKAENSDIFTVSSDSLDTTDLIPEKTKVTPCTPHAADDDESVNESDDESSSDAPIIAEIVRHKKSLPSTPTVLQSTTVTNVASKMETRAKGERSPIIKGKLSHLRLQPVVCMKKICEKDLYRRSYGKSLSPQKTTPTTSPKKSSPTKNEPSSSPTPPVQQQQLTVIAYTNAGASTNNRTSSSPKTKISPRKLRKPRGQWYRER